MHRDENEAYKNRATGVELPEGTTASLTGVRYTTFILNSISNLKKTRD